MKKYNGKSLGVVPPHVFAIGMNNQENLVVFEIFIFYFR
jgi:hypothetical protein